MAQVLHRDGLIHRQCVVSVDPAAMEKVIDEGFHPEMGARALKRALERQFTQPIAARLAQAAPDAPAVISLLPGPDGINVHVNALTFVDHTAFTPLEIDLTNGPDVMDRIDAVIQRVGVALDRSQSAGELTQGALSPANFRYLAIRELMEQIRQTAERLDRLVVSPRRRSAISRPKVQAPRAAKKLMAMSNGDVRICLRAAADLESHLAAMELDPPPFGDSAQDQLIELVRDTAMMDMIAASGERDAKCLVWLRSPNHDAAAELTALTTAYASMFASNLGLSVSELPPINSRPNDPSLSESSGEPSRQRALLMEMPGIARVMAGEHGTHLFTGWGRGTVVIQAIIVPAGDRNAAEILHELQSTDRNWRAAVRVGDVAVDPFELQPVLRIYDGGSMTVDLRSGLAVKGLPLASEMRKFIVSQLPMPVEFSGGK